jgi:hypothetical protein
MSLPVRRVALSDVVPLEKYMSEKNLIVNYDFLVSLERNGLPRGYRLLFIDVLSTKAEQLRFQKKQIRLAIKLGESKEEVIKVMSNFWGVDVRTLQRMWEKMSKGVTHDKRKRKDDGLDSDSSRINNNINSIIDGLHAERGKQDNHGS